MGPLLKMCPDFKLEHVSRNCNSSGFVGPNSTRSSRGKVQVGVICDKHGGQVEERNYFKYLWTMFHMPKNTRRYQAKKDGARVDGSHERWPKVFERRGQTK